jgi:2-methylfumaryl-CoA hydratase
VVISTAKALSFNGLQNAGLILAINGGRHVAPFFAGGTVFAWSEVLDKAETSAKRRRPAPAAGGDQGPALRRLPGQDAEGAYDPAVILDFDYWAAVPKRG